MAPPINVQRRTFKQDVAVIGTAINGDDAADGAPTLKLQDARSLVRKLAAARVAAQVQRARRLVTLDDVTVVGDGIGERALVGGGRRLPHNAAGSLHGLRHRQQVAGNPSQIVDEVKWVGRPWGANLEIRWNDFCWPGS